MNLTFNESTDTEHKEKLESSLVSAAWLSGSAPAGGTVKFEVITEFVGNGAPIKISGKSEKGKKLGKVTDVIRNNKYIGKFTVPEDIELDDKVYFEVSVPKDNLSATSERIPAAPAIKINNMKWSVSKVHRTDVVKLTAFVDGVNDMTEITLRVYEYDENGAHDKVVALPGMVKDRRVEVNWEFDYHGNTEDIPTQDELNQYDRKYAPPKYFFTIMVGDDVFGNKQESGLLEFKDWIEIQLANPVGKEKYHVKFPDGTEKKGKFESNGVLKFEDIPPGKYIVDVETED